MFRHFGIAFYERNICKNDIAHNLRNNRPMRIPKTRTSSYGIESLSCLGCRLWTSLRDEFKSIKTLASFETQFKRWKDNAAAGYAENSLAMSVS